MMYEVASDQIITIEFLKKLPNGSIMYEVRLERKK